MIKFAVYQIDPMDLDAGESGTIITCNSPAMAAHICRMNGFEPIGVMVMFK
jgi:hypothetical protein